MNIANEMSTLDTLCKKLCDDLREALKQVSKESFDNDSKASSGYGDDFNDSENKSLDENETADDDIVIISDDDYYDIDSDFDDDVWTICSDSDVEHICNCCCKDAIKVLNPTLKHFRVLKDLPLYPPSEGMKISKAADFTIKSLRDNNDAIKDYVKNHRLIKDNIQNVFKSMLEIEDITSLSQYPGLAQKDVIVNLIPPSYKREYWIPISNVSNIDDIVTPFMDELVLIPKESSALAEADPPKYMIDTLFPHPHETEKQINLKRRLAIIFKVTRDQVHFRFSKEENFSPIQLNALSSTKYDIIFRPRRQPMRYQLRALEMLSDNEHVRDYLFPQANPFKEVKLEAHMELNLFNSTISSNPEQLEAVHFITEGASLNKPFVIFGPPGTGKTTTIVESILQLRLLNHGNRILVTAASNSACDTIALRICQYFKSNAQLQDIQKRDTENQKPIIRLYSKSIIEKGLHQIDAELLANSNCPKGLHYYPAVEEIRKYGIIVCTLCTVGKLVTGDVGKMNFFSHIFIDEAGSCTEPEALVGIMGIKSVNCRVILSGDHKQLGPILKSERAVQMDLDKSLMERLLSYDCYGSDENCNYDRTIQARLKRNYRSHPEIVRIFNHLYYNNELIAEAKLEDVNMAAKWDKLPNANFPIIFQAVHGVTERDTISPSSRNNLEIQVLIWFLRRLLNDGINGRRVAQSDIGVITPYRLQSDLIHARLHEHGWTGVESGSVETFQGREKQIIIVSFVKSFTGLGFIKNSKRLNVILSRPKSLLILMGNPVTLKRHPDFAYIMDECRRNKTFLRKKKSKKSKKRKAAKTLTPFTI